jgi:hypothetical protein
MNYLKTLSIFLLFVAICSCNSVNSNDRVCTLEFRTFSATVLTPSGAPADSVDISITIGNSSEFMDPCTEVYGDSCDQEGADGTYIIFHDGFMDEINEGKDATVMVEGTRAETSFSQEFVFTNDGCHIGQVAGPDTVRLQAKP